MRRRSGLYELRASSGAGPPETRGLPHFFGRGKRAPTAADLVDLLARSGRAFVHVNASAFEAWQTSDPRTRTR